MKVSKFRCCIHMSCVLRIFLKKHGLGSGHVEQFEVFSPIAFEFGHSQRSFYSSNAYFGLVAAHVIKVYATYYKLLLK